MTENTTSAVTPEPPKTGRPDYSRSLHFSMLDGIFGSVAGGFVFNYVTPFALALKATNFQIGILSSLPALLSSLSQFRSADMLERIKSRARITGLFVGIQAAMFLLMPLIAFAFGTPYSVAVLIAVYSVAMGANSFVNPMWSSLMSDTVDKQQYGKVFGWRNRIFGLIGMASSFAAGFFLDLFSNRIFSGFLFLFGTAAVARFFSGYFISRMTDIPVNITKEDRFTYFQFIRRLPESNFTKFTVAYSLFNFAVSMISPFFAVYMLKELSMKYSTYTIVNIASALTSTLFLPFWGYYADKHGNAKIIKIAALIASFLPALWAVSSNVFFILAINMVGGYVWSALNLCTNNFIYDAAIPSKRPRVIAYYNITLSVFSSAGMLAGGLLAVHMPAVLAGSTLLTLFVLSSVIRVIAALVMFRTFKEVRPAEEIDEGELLLKVLQFGPVTQFMNDTLFFWRKKPKR